jgi:hypothetical protein
MSSPSIFGRILTGGQVEEACLAVLKRWSSTYIAEVERQVGLTAGELARFRSFTIAPTLDKYPEDQLPALLVISPGTVPPPVRRSGGVHSVSWLIGLGCVCSASTAQLSRRNARIYVAACRAALAQRQSLDGFDSDGIDWLDESYDDLTVDDARSLGWGIAHFSVAVDDVLTTFAGPTTPDEPLAPDTDPWPDDPTAELVEVELVKELAGVAGREEEE